MGTDRVLRVDKMLGGDERVCLVRDGQFNEGAFVVKRTLEIGELGDGKDRTDDDNLALKKGVDGATADEAPKPTLREENGGTDAMSDDRLTREDAFAELTAPDDETTEIALEGTFTLLGTGDDCAAE